MKLLAEKQKKIEQIAQRVEIFSIEIPDANGDYPPANIAKYAAPGIRLNVNGSEDYLVSDICTHLYTHSYPASPFVLCITSDGTTSLRSNKDGSNFDVSAIAKAFGGGGHHNAAGYKNNNRAGKNN